MLTANEILQDEAISHAIDFQKYSTNVVNRIIRLLNDADTDIVAQILAALEQLPAESFTVERLDSLLYSAQLLNRDAYNEVGKELTKQLRELVDYEAGYQKQLFEHVLPVQVNVASVVVEQCYASALSRPMQSRLLSEWASGIESSRMVRIRDALRLGYVEGQTISQMVARIRGTRARGYSDGLLEIDRRNCAAVVRTATAHVANFTRQRFYEGNDSLIKALTWCSTLDSRTSAVCRARDGVQYPLSSGPRPPGHFGCRSTMVPVLRSWKDLGIDMEELPPSTRASVGEKFTGQVPETMTYQDWLRKQSAGYQDDILGVSKGKLFRDGGLTLDRFVDRSGRELTLDQLRAKDAAAFSKAGL